MPVPPWQATKLTDGFPAKMVFGQAAIDRREANGFGPDSYPPFMSDAFGGRFWAI
jgi:hypothetical protein